MLDFSDWWHCSYFNNTNISAPVHYVYSRHIQLKVGVETQGSEVVTQGRVTVDRDTISYERLRTTLSTALNLKSDFLVRAHIRRTVAGGRREMTITNERDLDEVLRYSRNVLRVTILLKSHTQEDVKKPEEKTPNVQRKRFRILSHIGSAVEGAVKRIGRSILPKKVFKPGDRRKAPMSFEEFQIYLDKEGRLIDYKGFRESIYLGGVVPSMRIIVWRHLLCVFPSDLTAAERVDYLNTKSSDYTYLKNSWKKEYTNNNLSKAARLVTTMVMKDALRADRCHKYYQGKDDNPHTMALFDILCTYALCHPEITYCQGMSDFASALLIVQKDEAHTYILFCAIMQRVKNNFVRNSKAITQKFKDLKMLFEYFDPEFFAYMNDKEADELVFAYRWLLLEMKREFPFNDAMYFCEVMWSTLPMLPSKKGVELAQAAPITDLSRRLYRITEETSNSSADVKPVVTKKNLDEIHESMQSRSPSTYLDESPSQHNPIVSATSCGATVKSSLSSKYIAIPSCSQTRTSDSDTSSSVRDPDEYWRLASLSGYASETDSSSSTDSMPELEDVDKYMNPIGQIDQTGIMGQTDRIHQTGHMHTCSDENRCIDGLVTQRTHVQNSCPCEIEPCKEFKPDTSNDGCVENLLRSRGPSQCESEPESTHSSKDSSFSSCDETENSEMDNHAETSVGASNMGAQWVSDDEGNYNSDDEDIAESRKVEGCTTSSNLSGSLQVDCELPVDSGFESKDKSSHKNLHPDDSKHSNSQCVTGLQSQTNPNSSRNCRAPHNPECEVVPGMRERSGSDARVLEKISLSLGLNREMADYALSTDSGIISGTCSPLTPHDVITPSLTPAPSPLARAQSPLVRAPSPLARAPLEKPPRRSKRGATSFPSPRQFGFGNPFLIFAALAMLLHHRDLIMSKKMDFGDICVLYTKHKGCYNVQDILAETYQLYEAYIRDDFGADENEYDIL